MAAVSEGSTVDMGKMHNDDKNAVRPAEMGPAPRQKGGQDRALQDPSDNLENTSGQENAEKTSKDMVSLDEINKDVWILLGASFMVLITGILFAVKFRK